MKTPLKRELKRLSRAELLEIIYELKKKEENLQSMLIAAQEKLKERKVLIDNAGSIAEASLALYDVFGAAQRAVNTYVSSVRDSYARIEEKCAKTEKERSRILEEARIQADKIVEDAEKKRDNLIEAMKAEIKVKNESETDCL